MCSSLTPAGNSRTTRIRNRLREQDIDKIVEVFGAFRAVDKYSYTATFDEIVENDFNLQHSSLCGYVRAGAGGGYRGCAAGRSRGLETELAEAEAELEGYLKELDL